MNLKNISKCILSFSLPLLAGSPVFANVLGDMQTFSPNTDGMDFITVHSARPLAKNYFAFSNYVNYAKDHLLVYKNLAAQDRMDYEDSLLEYDFGLAYGWTENFQVSLQMPVLLSHSTKEQDGVRVNIKEGIHSFRPGFKWNQQLSETTQWAFLGSLDLPFLENSPYTGTDSRPIVNLEGAYSWSKESRIQSLNAGLRLRNPSATPADAHMYPLKSQLTMSYGYSDKFSSTARWVFETIASYPLDKEPYKDAIDASSLDLLLGMKHRWYKNLNFDWGATIEPGIKTLSPTYRIFAGLVYYWKPSESTSSAPQENKLERPFVVVPGDKTIKTYEFIPFFAEGDGMIDSCRVVEGPGSLSPGCEFMSDSPGTSRLEFKDVLGRTVYRTMQIKEPKSAQPLAFTQDSWNVYTGSSIQVSAVGGKQPYQFSIYKGKGTMSPSGFYEAPLKEDIVFIRVKDKLGNTASATINVITPPKEDKAIDLSNLEFITATSKLTGASLTSLRENLETLRRMDIQKLIVEGHTDSVGPDQYNQKLSRERASTVKELLIRELGMERNNIDAVGYGESRPLTSNKTPQGRQKNRRVVLKVYYKK